MKISNDKIEKLWKWFYENDERIRRGIEDESSIDQDYIVENLDNLILDLGLFSWEIAPGKVKKWSLTLSPNGDKDLLIVSAKIIAGAPANFEHWEFNHFRQAKEWDRKFPIYDENMDEQNIDSTNWNYVAIPKGETEFDLILEANNLEHIDDFTMNTAAGIVVINEIGEETRIIKISSIKIVNQLENKFESLKASIDQLKGHFKT